MPAIKTAVSLDEGIFKKTEELSCKMNMSRSEFVSKALECYINEIENRTLFNMINKSCQDYKLDTDEHLNKHKEYKRRKLESEGDEY